jgi:hypothetical protein
MLPFNHPAVLNSVAIQLPGRLEASFPFKYLNDADELKLICATAPEKESKRMNKRIWYLRFMIPVWLN